MHVLMTSKRALKTRHNFGFMKVLKTLLMERDLDAIRDFNCKLEAGRQGLGLSILEAGKVKS